jgi:hypothetical protein
VLVLLLLLRTLALATKISVHLDDQTNNQVASIDYHSDMGHYYLHQSDVESDNPIDCNSDHSDRRCFADDVDILVRYVVEDLQRCRTLPTFLYRVGIAVSFPVVDDPGTIQRSQW